MDQSPRRPWRLWAFTLGYLFLGVVGACDFVLTMNMNASYFHAQGYGLTQISYFTDYPVLPRCIWLIAVIGAISAPMLVLLGSRMAPQAAAVTVLAQTLLLAVTFAFMGRWAALGLRSVLADVAVLLAMLAFWRYCCRLHAHRQLH